MTQGSNVIATAHGGYIVMGWDESPTFILCSASEKAPGYLEISEDAWRLTTHRDSQDQKLRWRGSPVFFQLDVLDDLLDALHEARREIVGAERVERIVRLPVELRDRLESKARKEGITSQNAAIIEAIERYLAE